MRKRWDAVALSHLCSQLPLCLKISCWVLLSLGMPGASLTASEPAGIQWVSYTPSALKHSGGKPILVDVEAEWCAICHRLNRTTYHDPRVIEMANHFLMVRLDATDPDHPPTSAFIDRYRVDGVPTLVVFSAKGRQRSDLRLEGYFSAEALLDVMRALQQSPPSEKPERAKTNIAQETRREIS